jgi:hypothetical protein
MCMISFHLSNWIINSKVTAKCTTINWIKDDTSKITECIYIVHYLLGAMVMDIQCVLIQKSGIEWIQKKVFEYKFNITGECPSSGISLHNVHQQTAATCTGQLHCKGWK